MKRVARKIRRKLKKYKFHWRIFIDKATRVKLSFKLLVSNKRFIDYVKNSNDIKGMTKYSRWKWVMNMKTRGTLGTYLIRDSVAVVNLGLIYSHHEKDYIYRSIETIVHETLHHVFYKFVGNYVNEEQEFMIMEMGFYTGMRTKLRKEKKVKE